MQQKQGSPLQIVTVTRVRASAGNVGKLIGGIITRERGDNTKFRQIIGDDAE